MSHQIDYSTIGWEQFEDICTSLWFDEGFVDIQPMGRRREQGRDAIFIDSKTGEQTIFQFKCWVTQYQTSKLKSMIKEACKKISRYHPEKIILNTVQKPNATINDWIPQLEKELGFSIEYHDRSWTDLRLNNRRQDLRFDYFGFDLNHHTWESLRSQSKRQISQTINSLSFQYSSTIYVNRKAEDTFLKFDESDKIGLMIIDRTGRGKTNLLCKLAMTLVEQEKVVIFIRCSHILSDDNGLLPLANDAFGYDQKSYQPHMRDLAKLLQEHNRICYILIDGLSEINDYARANQSLVNFLIFLAELKCFKICVTCRDSVWPLISYGLPKNLLYIENNDSDKPGLFLDDFNDVELDKALNLYCIEYNINFSPTLTAREQLKHPLLLRLFCEAHRNKFLGSISTIPVAQTFELYLDKKAQLIIGRINGKYDKFTIFKLLENLVGQMWIYNDAKFLIDDQWNNFDPNITLSEKEELLRLMAEEGIISITIGQKPHKSFRIIKFIFDELHDYLLLKYLFSLFPKSVHKEDDEIPRIGIEILKKINKEKKDPIAIKLFSLIGMLLPEISERKNFLKGLLDWDFYTFCSCLAHMPPIGTINHCTYRSLYMLAKELQYWYQLIISKVITTDIRTSLDTEFPSKNKAVAIEIIASPECREISYTYTRHKDKNIKNKSIKVKQISIYPTFEVSIGTEKENIKLHDPDRGKIITTWHSDGFIKHTINVEFPPHYIGESVNAPERMSLSDVWGELSKIFNQMSSSLPQIPTFLSNELSFSKENPPIELDHLNDDDLIQYLLRSFGLAINSYRLIVEKYFPDFKSILNLAVQIPCHFLFITDRISVRYAVIPDYELNDSIKFHYRVVNSDFNLADPKWYITIKDADNIDEDSEILFDHVCDVLESNQKSRPPIHPIDKVEPIDNFFINTPINDLVTRWLISDFRLLFGF